MCQASDFTQHYVSEPGCYHCDLTDIDRFMGGTTEERVPMDFGD